MTIKLIKRVRKRAPVRLAVYQKRAIVHIGRVKTKVQASKRGHEAYHCGHWLAHCAYLLAVFVEGHGIYATMGGVLLLLTVVGLVFGGPEA